MYNLDRLLDSIIKDHECKDLNVVAFIQDHVNKLKEKSILFGKIEFIYDTERMLKDYKVSTKKCNILLRIRKEKTKEVNALIDEYKSVIHYCETLIILLFKKNSDVYLQFFPQGLTGFSCVTKEKLNDHLILFEAKLHIHSEKMGIGLIEKFSKLKSRIIEVRNQQLEIISNLETQTKQKNTQKKELLKLFQRNIYYAYIQNFANPKIVKKLFNQSFLKHKSLKLSLLSIADKSNGNGVKKSNSYFENEIESDFQTTTN